MQYIPILKVRASEIGAVRELDESIREQLSPVFVFPPLPLNLRGLSPHEIHEKYMMQLLSGMIHDWSFRHPVYFDMQYLLRESDPDLSLPRLAFETMAEAGMQFIPVLSLHSSPGFKRLLRNTGRDNKGRGFCLYVDDRDYGVENLLRPIDRVLEELHCEPEDIDLILDYKTVTESHRNALFASVVYRLSGLPYLERWRRLALAAVSYPYTMNHFGRGMVEIPRVEWRIWQQLRKTKLRRIPIFSDYNTFHPIHPDADPKDNPEINRLRYTVDGKWLILNEVDMERMSMQTLSEHCRSLVESDNFCGRGFSWGDNFIYECAYNIVGINTESVDMWKKACTAHHLTFTVRQLMGLGQPGR